MLEPFLKTRNLSMNKSILIVGAGFSGAVIARELALQDYRVDVIDQRDHIAGNCYSSRDSQSGVLVHNYGPHIFHTDNVEVWNYLQQFGDFLPYTNRVKAISAGRVYSLPINLLTINQFYQRNFKPKEAEEFIRSISDQSIIEPKSFEEQALKFVGADLYKAFFYGYTKQQCGCEPQELPASILQRLPLRFNYNDNYFNHRYQAMPKDGYTEIINKILQHPNISLRLKHPYDAALKPRYEHVFYSGPLDLYFNHRLGRLDYRSLKFETIRAKGDYQGTAVMNYCDEDVPYTRISEHKHFAPWEQHEETICFREYSIHCGPQDIPYYPIRLAKEKTILDQYLELAAQESSVTFVGRLGTYRYLDMDTTIAEALSTARSWLARRVHA